MNFCEFQYEEKHKLFSKFARLSAQPTGGEHSTGLGLSIVKKLSTYLNVIFGANPSLLNHR